MCEYSHSLGVSHSCSSLGRDPYWYLFFHWWDWHTQCQQHMSFPFFHSAIRILILRCLKRIQKVPRHVYFSLILWVQHQDNNTTWKETIHPNTLFDASAGQRQPLQNHEPLGVSLNCSILVTTYLCLAKKAAQFAQPWGWHSSRVALCLEHKDPMIFLNLAPKSRQVQRRGEMSWCGLGETWYRTHPNRRPCI